MATLPLWWNSKKGRLNRDIKSTWGGAFAKVAGVQGNPDVICKTYIEGEYDYFMETFIYKTAQQNGCVLFLGFHGNSLQRKTHKKYNPNNVVNIPGPCTTIYLERAVCSLYEYQVYGKVLSHFSQPLYVESLAMSLFKSLAWLHKCGFIHCDLKPDNVLIRNIDGAPIAVVADFGSAYYVPFYDKECYDMPTRRKATSGFEPVEDRRPTHLTKASDVFSAACVLVWYIVCPRKYDSKENVHMTKFFEKIPSKYPLHSLMRKMLNFSPSLRPTALECLEEIIHSANEISRDLYDTVVTAPTVKTSTFVPLVRASSAFHVVREIATLLEIPPRSLALGLYLFSLVDKTYVVDDIQHYVVMACFIVGGLFWEKEDEVWWLAETHYNLSTEKLQSHVNNIINILDGNIYYVMDMDVSVNPL